MATFFSKYPKLILNNRLVTDIIARTALKEKYSNRLSVFYPYDLQDGDTPEIIAHKYYGDTEKHWLVLLANEIMDATFDFPLGYQEFENYLNEKYKAEGLLIDRTGAEYSKITIYGYRAIIQTTDELSGVITTEKYNIDENSYNSQYGYGFDYSEMTTTIGSSISYSQSKEIVYIFDYENELNESKRTIKLIREEYASQLEHELKILMRRSYG